MPAIDATGVRALEDLAERLRGSGRTLLLCGTCEQPAARMERGRVPRASLGRNICPDIEAALRRAEELHLKVAA